MTKSTPSRTRTGTSATTRTSDAGGKPDRRHPKLRQALRRTPVRPPAETAAQPPRPATDHASHPEDAAGDDRFAHALAANAGRSPLARHRERVTGIENEEDGVPEDEDVMEDAAQAEIDSEEDNPLWHHPST
jgi:hypothetical protein